MTTCAVCGHRVHPEDRFCGKCGHSLGVADVTGVDASAARLLPG